MPSGVSLRRITTVRLTNPFEGGFFMNCYDCAIIQVASAAVAVCLQCGVAVCSMHAYERYLPAVPVGMAGPGSPGRRELICQLCFHGWTARDSAQQAPGTKQRGTFLIYSTDNSTQQKNGPLAGYHQSANEPLDERTAVEVADALVRSQPVRHAHKRQQKIASLFNRLFKFTTR
jgi:hypothetical protein